jgi:hypothetical protein
MTFSLSAVFYYSLSVQGFFVKPSSMTELEEPIYLIMEYWKRCASPNNFWKIKARLIKMLKLLEKIIFTYD